MAKFALIRNNKVQNIIAIENDPELLEHFRIFHKADEIVEAQENCEIDGAYTNGIFERKPIEIQNTEE